MVEIAVATHTAPRDWYDESDEVIATALEILETNARAIRKASRRGK